MTKLDHALALAAAGFWVFPIKPNAKTPVAKGWQMSATRAPSDIRAMWAEAPYNIGIYTGKFRDDEALLVVDVDTKAGKNGATSLLALEFAGDDLPDTREHATASGGRHLLYSVREPVRQGTDILGNGLDTRSRGGYVVAPGSAIGGKVYDVAVDTAVAPAPAWLVERCGKPVRPRSEHGDVAPAGVNRQHAYDRAAAYLRDDAPTALDPDAYAVACRLKDFGVTEDVALELMQTHWDPRCDPPRSDNTVDPVRNAYRYGENAPGASAPEAEFKPVVKAEPELVTDSGDPIERFNKEFAFVLAGGGDHILWQTVDVHGRPKLEHLNTESFHRRFSAERISFGNKTVPKTKVWMEDKRRRTYDGIAFVPGGPRDIVVKEDGD